MERKPSEIIQDFIDLIDNSHAEFNDSKSKVDDFNSKTYVWTHQLEDCKNKQERNKLATSWQKELKEHGKRKTVRIFGRRYIVLELMFLTKPF